MKNASMVRMTGPLAPYREGVWAELGRRGYTPLSRMNLLRVMAHLSRWLEGAGLAVGALSAATIAAFFTARRRAGYTQFRTPRSLAALLDLLEGFGLCPRAAGAARPRSPREDLEHDYQAYLRRERSLTAPVAQAYTTVAGRFLSSCGAPERRALAQIGAGDVTAFVLQAAHRGSTGEAKHVVSALRSFLRYLSLRHAIPHELAGAVPGIAGWRLSGLPKGLEPPQIRQLLRSCDRRTHTGCRDYAILLVLVRLGLRAGEVAALALDDLDWAQGELVVRGKGARQDRLPLPEDVGAGIARYLHRGRPPTPCRRVFLRLRAPQGGLTRHAVSAMVAGHFVRAGLARAGAHRLRHTAATQMLRRGGSLDEVAQVLRHQSHDTTAIYAKVDRHALRAVAQPWPGAAS